MENLNNQKEILQSAIYYFMNSRSGDAFYGNLLQTIDISYSLQIPTAGIYYDKNTELFKVIINPDFFCALSPKERVAILHHEILHFTNKHLFRMNLEEISETQKQLWNIAGDMAINQMIVDLPKEAIDVGKFKLNDGKPFPLMRSMEEYKTLLEENETANTELMKNMTTLDVHDWWERLSEEEKQKMLAEARSVIKRTLEKTVNTYSKAPDSLKDFLDTIDGLLSKINYKEILRRVLKRTVCTSERTSTWNRPNKRYGVYAPGTKPGTTPKLSIYIDTSGSISTTEMNHFINILEGFLKSGSRTCCLNLWHTELYYKRKFKLQQKVQQDIIESGGTNLDCVLADIKKSNPNLSVILTDGYYDSSVIKTTSEVIFIISKGGNPNHPMKGLGKTILLENLI